MTAASNALFTPSKSYEVTQLTRACDTPVKSSVGNEQEAAWRWQG